MYVFSIPVFNHRFCPQSALGNFPKSLGILRSVWDLGKFPSNLGNFRNTESKYNLHKIMNHKTNKQSLYATFFC